MMNQDNLARLFNHDDRPVAVGHGEVIQLPVEKPVHYGKKRGQKSEVFAYDLEDMAKILGYFSGNGTAKDGPYTMNVTGGTLTADCTFDFPITVLSQSVRADRSDHSASHPENGAAHNPAIHAV